MPSRSALIAGAPAFAQYFAPHPISFDNKPAESDYYTESLIDPMGRNGAAAAYGGALRDRPLPRDPIQGDWELEDMKTEVRQAISAGLDGFTVGIISATSKNFQRAKLLIEAAELVDPTFRIVLTPDLAGTLGSISADEMAEVLADVSGDVQNGTWVVHPSMYRPEGKVVVHPFPSNRRSAAYWSEVKAEYRTRTGGTQLELWLGLSNWKPQHKAYESVATAYASWGEGSVSRNQNIEGNAALAHSEGKGWMQYIHPFDQRPIQHQDKSLNGYYSENIGSETLSLQWEGAIESGADAVQLITWNDYSETPLAPSVGHGWGPLDLSSYYLIKYKTGSYPTIKRDAVYVLHRSQKAAAKPKCATYVAPKIRCSLPMLPQEETTAPVDIVEVQTYLTAPGIVNVQVGDETYEYSAPAGRDVHRLPLSAGTISAEVERSAATVAEVVSPYLVTERPEVQDMQYHIVSSLREHPQGGTAPSEEPSAAPTATPSAAPSSGAETTMRASVVADTYVNSTNPLPMGKEQTVGVYGSPTVTALLRFVLPPAPQGRTLVAAELTGRTGSTASSGTVDRVSVSLADNDWNETSTVYKTRPTVAAAELGAITARSKPKSVVKVTLDPKGLAGLSDEAITLALEGSGKDSLWLLARENVNGGPVLELTYR